MALYNGFGNASGIVFNDVDYDVDAVVVRDRELNTRPMFPIRWDKLVSLQWLSLYFQTHGKFMLEVLDRWLSSNGRRAAIRGNFNSKWAF